MINLVQGSRRGLLLGFAVGLSVGFLPALARAAQGIALPQDPMSEAIKSVHAKFWESFAERDLWGQAQIWDKADELISAMFPAATTPSFGWENVAESLRHAFAHNRDIKTETQIIRLHRAGDFAWLISVVRFEAVQTQTGQRVLISRMMVTELFEQRGGNWKLVHFHGHNPSFLIPKEGPEGMSPSGVVLQRTDSDIWGAYDKFGNAFRQLDLGGMFDVFAPEDDASTLHPTSPVPFIGPQNVLASWRKTFADIEALTCDPQVLKLSVVGSIGWMAELSQFHIVFKDAPDEIRHYHNVLATYVFRRSDDEWRLVHYHAHFGYAFDDHAH
jgi:ketosteroid isomerase-like protein